MMKFSTSGFQKLGSVSHERDQNHQTLRQNATEKIFLSGYGPFVRSPTLDFAFNALWQLVTMTSRIQIPRFRESPIVFFTEVNRRSVSADAAGINSTPVTILESNMDIEVVE